MNTAKLLIFTAMQMEAKPIVRALKLSTRSTTFASGSLDDGSAVDLHVIGVLGKRMPELARSNDQTIRAVLLAGLAGGLDPSLRCTDVVLDDPSNLIPPSCAPGIRRARIFGADRIISNAAEKHALFERSGCAAVEMESPSVQRAALALGAPFIHIRAIVDSAIDPLDPSVVTLLDDAGNVRLGAAIALLARRPNLIPQLFRTRAKAITALSDMTRAVQAVTGELLKQANNPTASV